MLLLAFSSSTIGQITGNSNDCDQAGNACGNGNVTLSPWGSGADADFTSGSISNPSSNPQGFNSGCLLSGELNPNFIIINIATSGNLQWSFGVDGGFGCTDWIMWPYTATTCTQISAGTLAPSACNWNGACETFTGMANPLPVGASPSNFQNPINVTAGQQYLLCISNYSSQSGTFPLNFFGTASVSCCAAPLVITASSTGGYGSTANSTKICPGGMASITAAGGTTYTWSPATGLSATTGTTVNATPATTQTYTITGTTGTCTGTTTYTVTVVPDPVVTATPGSCQPGNLYTLTGNITFSNQPTTGTLTVTTSCGGSQTFNAPFVSPLAYSIPNLNANGAPCTVTATFSASPSCSGTVNFNAPAACPCNISNFTANVSAPTCGAVGGTYGITGQVTFTNAPSSGTLTVSTSCGGTQIFNAPFVSPTNYSLTNINANGANCNITAVFSANGACTSTIPYTAPICPCNMDSLVVSIGACQPSTNAYDVDVHLVFSSPPVGGTLIVDVCGTQQILNPPFASPTNLTFTGLTSNGGACSVTATFSASPSCTNSLNYTAPVDCACPVDAGTVTSIMGGSGTTNYVLCDGDNITINSDGNNSPPNDFGAAMPTAYNPGLGYLIYSCPPTPGLTPNADPCFVGVMTTGASMNDVNDMLVINSFPVGTFTNNTVYYSIFTFYNVGTLEYNPDCYEVGAPVAVTYLPPIITNSVEDCMAGTATVTVSGGYPQILGGNFTASNLSPANASFLNTTAANGGTITISGLLDAQNYSFDITDQNGCPHTFTAGPFNGPPVANAGPDVTICSGLPATLNASGGVGYNWSSGQNTASITVSPAATQDFIVTVDDGTGCTDTDTAKVIVNSNFDATISPAGPFCESTAPAILTAADPGGTWSGPGITNAATGAFDPSLAGAGNPLIQYLIPGACGDTATINIQVIADADATITPSGPHCVLDAPLNLTGADAGGTWSGTGITSAANGTFSPSAAGAGTHTITYTISGVCGDAQTTNIVVAPQILATINPAGPFCVNALPTNMTSVNSGGTWSGPGITNAATGAFSPSVAGPGTHTITYTIPGSCGDVQTTNVVVNPLPNVSFSLNNASGCTPVTVTFTDNTLPAATSVLWDFDGAGSSNSIGTATQTFVAPGCYDVSLTVTSAQGCTASLTNTNMVCVFAIPTADFVFGPQPTTILQPEITFTNISVGASSYSWDFAGLGTSTMQHPVFAFPGDTAMTYPVCLDVISANGCPNSICHDVIISPEFILYVPNAFTPDGDGINDIFYPVINGYEADDFDLMIFNRWGEIIYSTEIASKGWDGTHKGMKAKEDVYVWKIKAKESATGDRRAFFGHVTLLR